MKIKTRLTIDKNRQKTKKNGVKNKYFFQRWF